MNKTAVLLALMLFVSWSPVAADETCIKDAIMIQDLNLANQPGEGLMLQTGQSFDYIPNLEALKLNLKRPTPTYDGEFKVTITNSLHRGAGYSSPYLWDVGQGPGLNRGTYTLPHPGFIPRR